MDVYPHIHIFPDGSIAFHPASGTKISFKSGESAEINIPKIKNIIDEIKLKQMINRDLWLLLYRKILLHYRPLWLSSQALELRRLTTGKAINYEETPEEILDSETNTTILDYAREYLRTVTEPSIHYTIENLIDEVTHQFDTLGLQHSPIYRAPIMVLPPASASASASASQQLTQKLDDIIKQTKLEEARQKELQDYNTKIAERARLENLHKERQNTENLKKEKEEKEEKEADRIKKLNQRYDEEKRELETKKTNKRIEELAKAERHNKLQADIAEKAEEAKAERLRLAEEAERLRLAEEAERLRLAKEAERLRLAEEAEKKQKEEAKKLRVEVESLQLKGETSPKQEGETSPKQEGKSKKSKKHKKKKTGDPALKTGEPALKTGEPALKTGEQDPPPRVITLMEVIMDKTFTEDEIDRYKGIASQPFMSAKFLSHSLRKNSYTIKHLSSAFNSKNKQLTDKMLGKILGNEKISTNLFSFYQGCEGYLKSIPEIKSFVETQNENQIYLFLFKFIELLILDYNENSIDIYEIIIETISEQNMIQNHPRVYEMYNNIPENDDAYIYAYLIIILLNYSI